MTRPREAKVVETHSSILFFVGDRVHKLKKPVDLGFLDFRTREARESACHQEVELNRRLAPDVYLGVEDLIGPDGRPSDHLVVMERMPDDRRLTDCVRRGEVVDDELRRVARALAALHASDPGDVHRTSGTPETLRRHWRDGFATLSRFTGDLVDATTHERIEHLVFRYLDGRAPLFDARVRHGHIRDGHGDLQADDIFLLPDGPRILDCLDFSEDLRCGDVVLDAAFLAMDLHRLGRPDLAEVFMAAYREYSGEAWPPSLEDHYIAYRAHIRAKVAAVRAAQEGLDVAPDVDRLQRLCLEHLEAGRVRLTLVGGTPGTGKSTVAEALGDRVDAVVLRSDAIRNDVLGDRAERYDAAAVDQVYGSLLAQAASLLALGEHVILDATWGDPAHRLEAREIADRTCADLVELRCVAPPTVCDERIRRRLRLGGDPSEATPEVRELVASRFAPWPEAVAISTTGSVDASTDEAEAHFGACRPARLRA